MAFVQQNTVNDYLSSSLLAPKSGAFRKTKSLGRHAASARATRKTYHRKAAQLFFVTHHGSGSPCRPWSWREVKNHRSSLRPAQSSRALLCVRLSLVDLKLLRLRP